MKNLLLLLILAPISVFSQGKKKSKTVIVNVGDTIVVSNTDTIITIPNTKNFTFTLTSDANVSAGVYKGKYLKRTLFGNRFMTAGKHTLKWDGLLDDFTKVDSVQQYTIKVLSSNVKYSWDGASIGNTGPLVGSGKFHSGDFTNGVTFVGDNAYWANGYNEGWPGMFITSVSNPSSGKRYIDPTGTNTIGPSAVTSDGSMVYFVGNDAGWTADSNICFVYAIDAITNSKINFQYGSYYKLRYGIAYNSAIDITRSIKSINTRPQSISVQQNGLLLAVARPGINEIHFFNKLNGKKISTYISEDCEEVCFDKYGYLWISHNNIIEKYLVDSLGVPVSTNVKIETIINAGAIGVNPTKDEIAVCDLSTQTLKGFSSLTGNILWELGTSGGYSTSSVVTNTKFYWNDKRGVKKTYIKYLPDGSFYLGDSYNRRTLIFDNNRNYSSFIGWQVPFYQCSVDNVDNSRVFAEMLEYKVDYSKPLGANNGSWQLTNNWGYDLDTSIYDKGYKLQKMHTMSNGKTFAFLRGSNNSNSYYMAELVKGGNLKINRSRIYPLRTIIGKDDNLYCILSAIGGYGYTRYIFSGFDSLGTPSWTTTGQTLDIIKAKTAPLFFVDYGDQSVFFDVAANDVYDNLDYHIYSYLRSDTNALYKTSRGTKASYTGQYPEDGWFDNGNGVNFGLNGGGGYIIDVGSNSYIWNYHGEFWKNSQTNKFAHYDKETGLPIGIFGYVFKESNQEADYGQEGNAVQLGVGNYGGTYYLYHNGESFGLHRWSISGMNTVQVQNAIFPSGDSVDNEGYNLLTGIRGDTLTDTLGIRMSPQNLKFSVTSGTKTYNPFEVPEVYANYKQDTGKSWVSIDLNNKSNISNWKVSFDLMFGSNYPADSTLKSGMFFDIVDSSGVPISRITYIVSKTGRQLIANNQLLTPVAGDIPFYFHKWLPSEISYNNGMINIRYGDFNLITSNPQKIGANKNNPSKILVTFFTGKSIGNRSIALKNIKLIKL